MDYIDEVMDRVKDAIATFKHKNSKYKDYLKIKDKRWIVSCITPYMQLLKDSALNSYTTKAMFSTHPEIRRAYAL
ncbi:hypothetical protein AMTR_s00054p00159050 [Amborella trichopoda]|uniref:Uncharacterized protein n=1 Tax=Amborella trichopoda TaxID=13333 RepID=U5DCP0_AMBTC|nr:hypothetical protein AMTR_s00054p00159050 [Amborella trichopoda]